MNRKCVDRLILFEEFTVDVFMLQLNFLIRHAIFSWQGVTRAVAPCSQLVQIKTLGGGIQTHYISSEVVSVHGFYFASVKYIFVVLCGVKSTQKSNFGENDSNTHFSITSAEWKSYIEL